MIEKEDWRVIQDHIDKQIFRRGEDFIQGKVVKNDPAKKLIWLKEFGDQPIPLIAFHYQVKYYITDKSGNTVPKMTKPYSDETQLLVPRVGDIVLVACHMGSRRLPKCLGVIQSTGYVKPGGDE